MLRSAKCRAFLGMLALYFPTVFPSCISQLYFSGKSERCSDLPSAKLFGTDLPCLSIWHTAHSSWLGNHHCSEVCSLKCAHMQCHVPAELQQYHKIHTCNMGVVCAIKCVKSGLNPASAAFSSSCVGVLPPTHLLYSKPQRHHVLQCTVPPLILYPKPQRHIILQAKHVSQTTSCDQNHTHTA